MTGDHGRTRALHGTEGHILLAGIVLSLLYLSFLSLSALLSPGLVQNLAGITATNVLFGRASGMSLSYALGFGHAVAMPLNMLIETILVLLFYPLFVFSLNHLLVIEFLRKVVAEPRGRPKSIRTRCDATVFPVLFFLSGSPFR